MKRLRLPWFQSYLLLPVCEPQQFYLQASVSPPVRWRKRFLHMLNTGPEQIWNTELTPNLPHCHWPSAMCTLGDRLSLRTDFQGGGSTGCQRRHSLLAVKPSSGKSPTDNPQSDSKLFAYNHVHTNLDTDVYSSFICNC